ncbi:DUF4283 domain-containing protein [Salix suchowensis]|nr:DUF4283 domain-containing protein [Salix suchowensis]
MSKEDEAYASKFFFSSPMSEMYAKDCLVLHESQAQPIAQEEAAMTAAFLGSDTPLLLSAGTTPMTASRHQASSPPCAMENDVSSFNDGVGVVVSYCIVGYVVGKFPGFKALNHMIVNTWKCKASLTIHESGWLVYRFLHEEDKLAVLSRGTYLVYGRPLILKFMPEFFDFSTADMSTVPVWIKLPNLPLQCWSPVCLSKIGSVLGKPVQCDILTSSMSRLSFARILVEIDLLANLKHSVCIALPNGASLNQKLFMKLYRDFASIVELLAITLLFVRTRWKRKLIQLP